MELPIAERCELCRFWKCEPESPDNIGNHPNDYDGHCHRYPPILLPNETAYQAAEIGNKNDLEVAADLERTSYCLAWGHPVTNSMTWCGEYSMAPGTRGGDS